MKTLYILRHAKSSWAEEGIADFDRPLNDRGLQAAPFMGRLAAERDILPDVVISSPAKRAAETAKLFCEAAGLPVPVYDDRIYEASTNTLRLIASELDDKFGSVMLVGHNPGIEGFIRFLTGRAEPMSTASLAIIGLDIASWRSVGGGNVLREIIRPKDQMLSLGNIG